LPLSSPSDFSAQVGNTRCVASFVAQCAELMLFESQVGGQLEQAAPLPPGPPISGSQGTPAGGEALPVGLQRFVFSG
jgi:hypothetical protein